MILEPLINWVCCADCGLLIRKKSKADKQWSICPSCSKVYVQEHIEDEKLRTLLVERLSNFEITNMHRLAIKQNRTFVCEKCSCVFVRLRRKKICIWCEAKPTSKRRCCYCKRVIVSGEEAEIGIICKACSKAMDNVKRSLEYACLVRWHAQYRKPPFLMLGRPKCETGRTKSIISETLDAISKSKRKANS